MEAPIYSALPERPFSIRLLRLQPSADASSPICCRLHTYSLSSRPSGSHLYEALSYVWGSPADPQLIFVGSEQTKFSVTQNLHAALVRLRDSTFERILWVDSVCINQRDEKEKAYQVSSMARIYGLAQRVVMWLGEEGNDSMLAFRELHAAARRSHERTTSKSNMEGAEHGTFDEPMEPYTGLLPPRKDDSARLHEERDKRERAVVALVGRAYFRRIWILQELAAARHILVTCGTSEMQSTTMRAGFEALGIEYYARWHDSRFQENVVTVISLMKTSSIHESFKGEPHLNILPLGNLVDMFRFQEATDQRDKVYALLGMCSDYDLAAAAKLQPDYSMGWIELFENLTKFIFGNTKRIIVSKDKNLTFIRARGFVLGRLDQVRREGVWDDIQIVRITSIHPFQRLDEDLPFRIRCRLRNGAEQILENDMACLLEDNRKLVIMREAKYYFKVVMVTDVRFVGISGEDSDNWQPWHYLLNDLKTDLIDLPLVWSWDRSLNNDPKIQDEEEQDVLLLMRDGTWHPPDPGHSHDLDLARALYGMAQTFLGLKEYGRSADFLAEMVRIAEQKLGLNHSAVQDALLRLSGVQLKRERYIKAKKLIVKRFPYLYRSYLDQLQESDWQRLPLILRIFCSTPFPTAWTEIMPDYLSKAMSEDLSEKDALDFAASLDDVPLAFFLDMAEYQGKDLISETTILAAATNQRLRHDGFKKLISHSKCVVTNLRSIMRALAKNGSLRGLIWEQTICILEHGGDSVQVMPDDPAEMALHCKHDFEKHRISFLQYLARPSRQLQHQTLLEIAQSPAHDAPRAMKFLIQHTGHDDIPNDVLTAAAGNDTRGQQFFEILLEFASTRIRVTGSVLRTALSEERNEDYLGTVFYLLIYRKDFNVDLIYLTSSRHFQKNYPKIWRYVERRRQRTAPLAQAEVEAVAKDQKYGYIQMKTLVHERRAEFRITEEILRAAMTPDRWWESERMLLLLYRHATKTELTEITQSNFLEHAASHGYEDTLNVVAERCNIDSIPTLLRVAQINKAYCKGDICRVNDILKAGADNYFRRMCGLVIDLMLSFKRSKRHDDDTPNYYNQPEIAHLLLLHGIGDPTTKIFGPSFTLCSLADKANRGILKELIS